MDGVAISAQFTASAVGVEIMRAGGNAVDAAVAMAVMLCVVDPANCGFAGYGGYMTIHHPGDSQARVVDFNTNVPDAFSAERATRASRRGIFMNGPHAVCAPAVPLGLMRAHACFGHRPFSELLGPAIETAARGFAVDRNLARAIGWMARRELEFTSDWTNIFCPGGKPLAEGDELRQQDLATTLQAYAEDPATVYQQPAFTRVWKHLSSEGASLTPGDASALNVTIQTADAVEAAGLRIFGPSCRESGFGILQAAFTDYLAAGQADSARLNDRALKQALFVEALRKAWRTRASVYSTPEETTKHTSHFCVVDPMGIAVSCTFTHGPLWFGSGIVVPGTGLVLNCGLNLARRHMDGTHWAAVNNLTPVVAVTQDGDRYVLGAPGGSRIPAIVLKLILESVLGDLPLDTAMKQPRVAVAPDGALEYEAGAPIDAPGRILTDEDFYGPASAMHIKADGTVLAVSDPRCISATAWV